MIRNSSLLLSKVTNTSVSSFASQVCRLIGNLSYLNMNQKFDTTQSFNGTEDTNHRVLTRKSLKFMVKSENESSSSTRSSASARRTRKVDLKVLESTGENGKDMNLDLAPQKKRGAFQKRIPTKDSCQNDDVQIKPNMYKKLKKDVNTESDSLQTMEKPLKGTIKGKNKSSINKIVKLESPPKNNQKFVGAHLSIAGGLYKCIEEAVRIGARSCGLFLKSQRQWASKPLTEDTIQMFKDTIQKHNFPVDKLLPHGSYLINCGSPDDQTLQKSRTALIDELQRCELLGIPLYNFHPGSSCGKISREECMDKISESINLAHSQTNNVITVIENMSCQGNTIGGKLEELKCIIDRVKDKSRIGVCIDTCHAFAAGYDVSTESGFNLFMQQLDDIVGLQYLKAVHLNDSKGKLGCHLDRHENIGKGHIGIEGFKLVMREPNFDNLPMILETPMELSDEEEIKILNSM